ncbi:MAG: glutaredoxin family protein [Candidatus Moranbacteria bacterium]|nr:glutaredoxin family protein [Candidatus Moranbacteria bacterium]
MPKVTIYSTPTCSYCKMTKTFFNEHNIEYVEKDISRDDKAREEAVAKSHQMSVPIIEIDDQIIVGFDQEKLSALLGVV